MIRNENVEDGSVVSADIIDLVAGTVSREVNGTVVWTRPFTAEELNRYGPQPLDIKGPYGDEGLSSAVNGEVLSYNGANWNNLHALPLDVAIPGRYLDTVAGTGFSVRYAGSNVANSNNTMWYPIFVPSFRTFDAIAINCSTSADAASGSLVRLGLYNVDPATSYPTSLIVDAGTVSIESTGLKEATFSSITLSAGWYYTMFSCYATGATRPAFHGAATAVRQIGSAAMLTNGDHFFTHVSTGNAAGSIDPRVAAPDPAPVTNPIRYDGASMALIYTSLRYA